MSDLDDIATVTVSTTGAGISRQGFGTIGLIVSDGVLGTPTVTTYASSAAVATAEGTDSPPHRMAVAAFSQSPRPKRVRVIKTGLAIAQSVSFTVAAATDGLVTSLTVYYPDGTSATFTHTASSDTTTTIATELAATISSGSTVVSATGSVAVITITNDTNGDLCYFTANSNLGTYLDNTADPGLSAALTAARAVDDDWYGVALDCNSEACIDVVALWAESNDKLFMACFADAHELTSGGTIGSGLVSAAYTKTIPFWHSIPRQYAGVAWLAARMIDLDQGQKNWSFATLAGITVDTLTSTQRGYLDTDKTSFYVTVANRNITFGTDTNVPGGAKVASGEWIDIIHGNDWIKVRTQEDVVSLIISAGKLPYTQAGINAVGAAVARRMNQAASERVGFLVPGSVVVFVPDLADVADADRQARILNDIEATGEYASAINFAGITLSLGY